MERWCEEVGLSVNPSKTELMIFTKKRKLEGFKAPILFGHELTLAKQVKYLGITFDSKLSWRTHLGNMVEKTIITFWQLRRAVGRTWGLSPKILSWLFTAVIRPRIHYGSLLWWPRVNLKVTKIKLAKVQRLACKSITGAMRTAPTEALEALIGLPPLEVWIKGEAISSFLRLRDSGQWQGRGSNIGHLAIERLAETEIPLSGIPVKKAGKKSRETRKFQVEIPPRSKWEQGDVRFDKETLVVYTDGSRIEAGTTGAGLFLERSGSTKSYPLGNLTTVFQAEVYAILEATRQPEVNDPTVKVLSICSDSQAALKALCAPHISSPLVLECWEALESVAEVKEVKLIWVPGHTGIPGNEKADEVAKEGASSPFYGPEPSIDWSRGQAKSLIKDWIWNKAKSTWMNAEGCRQAKMLLPALDRKKARWLLGRSKPNLRIMVGVLTGHCTLRRHLALMKVVQDSMCPICGDDEETAYHFLGNCEGYYRLRFQIFGAGDMREEELESLGWQDILTFVNQTKRFNKELEVV